MNRSFLLFKDPAPVYRLWDGSRAYVSAGRMFILENSFCNCKNREDRMNHHVFTFENVLHCVDPKYVEVVRDE